MNNLSEIAVFLRVAELGSFTHAADSLGLPKASVSTAVKQLEARLGTRLLQRTTRKVQLTADGAAFYERGRGVLADVEELESMFHGDADVAGRLRIDMSSGIARHIVIPRLPEFLAAHPRLEVELSSTDRRVDVVGEGFDCVVRVGALASSSLVARPLGHFRQINCASPAYLAQYGVPETLDDLARHRLVHYAPVLGARPDGFEYVEGKRVLQRAMAGVLTVNNAEAYQAACLAGLGLIQAPDSGLRPLIDAGQLREVLPDYQAAPMPVSLLYAHRRHVPKRAQVFMDWIAACVRPWTVEA